MDVTLNILDANIQSGHVTDSPVNKKMLHTGHKMRESMKWRAIGITILSINYNIVTPNIIKPVIVKPKGITFPMSIVIGIKEQNGMIGNGFS